MARFDGFDRDELITLIGSLEAYLDERAARDPQRTLLDLQLHQVELELQNRELRESQQALEEARDRYAELYDFAPVGYLSLGRSGVIRNINLAGARMLGYERAMLVDKPIVSVLAQGSAGELSHHLRTAFDAQGPVDCEIAVTTRKSQVRRDFRLESSVRTGHDGETYCFTVMSDISERCAAQRKVIAEQEFLQTIIDGVDQPIMVITNDYEVVRLNRTAERRAVEYGRDWRSLRCYELLHGNQRPCTGDDQPCPMPLVRETHAVCKVLHDHVTRDNAKHKYEVSATPLFNAQGEVQRIVEATHDVTEHFALLAELKESELSYAHLAEHDPLTSLPNRLLFADRLTQAMRVAHRNRSRLAVLFIDLDQFKRINDSFGHACGDRVLKAAADRLLVLFREEDTVARMGGDEFTVILTDVQVAENAALVARKILQEFTTPFDIDGQVFHVGASIGVSIYPEHGSTVDELVRNADTAMYRAKDQGRRTFQYYSRDLTDRAFERVRLEASLHEAVAGNALELYFQPQIELASQGICGVEALIRWPRAGGGMLMPADFVPLAEETGIIIPMGRWILETACRQLKCWIDNGTLEPAVTMSVNISGKQFNHPQLLEDVQSALRKSGLAPGNLELEVTESITMGSIASTAKTLTALRQMGIGVAIDDFGTGYCSLSYLKTLPLTRLKIDRSFVADVPRQQSDVAITRTIIALADNLSLDVLAEGVETEEQLLFLKQEGCRSGQGRHFSCPLSADEFAAWVLQRKA